MHNTKLPPVPVRIVILLVVLAVVYFGFKSLANDGNGELTASGSIEAVTVNISPEMAGRVKDVLVEEGQSVETNDPLLHLDSSLLTAQREVAAANLDLAKAAGVTAQNALEIARAQYQVALQAALAQDKKARLGDWFSEDQQQFDQPNWYFTRAEQAQAAQLQVDAAANALAEAKAKLAEATKSLDNAEFLAAEKRLLDARQAYLVSKDVNARAQNSKSANTPITPYNIRHCAKDEGYHFAVPEIMNRVKGCNADEYLTRASQALYDEAKAELHSAQQAYDKLLTTKAANDILQARADVSVMEEKYYAGLDHLRALQTGDQSPSVTAAQSTMDQAQAAYDQSQEAVRQSQANLDLLDAQVAKLSISAPIDGVILTRNVEPGEYVAPGAIALTMADLSNLTITVYVPEDRTGEVKLGLQAEVTVDSFPGVKFAAVVIKIADQAEFTPRNVQTVEGRSATVYAVKLKVDDPEGSLKLGMPADVTFLK